MIKSNFNIKKIEQNKENEDKQKFEAIIESSGVGSHMVFRTAENDDEFFIEEL